MNQCCLFSLCKLLRIAVNLSNLKMVFRLLNFQQVCQELAFDAAAASLCVSLKF